MKNKEYPCAAGNFRETALKTIRDYIATTNWMGVFEFPPSLVLLSTPLTGGEVNYEGQRTGPSPVVINLQAPKLRATVQQDAKGPYVVISCLRAGLWFSPYEETLFDGLFHAKAEFNETRGSGSNKVIHFGLPMRLRPFASGLEKLSNKHLKIICDAIRQERKELEHPKNHA